MRTLKKELAVVLATAIMTAVVPAQATTVKPKLVANKTMTAGKKGRAMTAASVKKFQKAGYTLIFASSKPVVATIDAKTGVIKATKAGSKTNITCRFVKKGTKTVTKKMKLEVKAKGKANSDTANGAQTNKVVVNFEGKVTAVNGDEVTLENGKVIVISSDTVFAGDPDTNHEVSEKIAVGNFIQGYTEDDPAASEVTASRIYINAVTY